MLVSVIIPALNEAAHIRLTVAAARRTYGREEVEVIVVDGGSADGTPELVPPEVRLLIAPRGRASQMNAGAKVADGEALVFCHADTELPAFWREAVLAALARQDVSGGTFQETFRPAVGILRLINAIRLPADWRLMFGDQVQFMRRSTFDQVGGFPDIPIMEDLEMSRALHRVGRLVRVQPRVTTSSRRFLEYGILRQLALDTVLLLRYLYLGMSAQEAACLYQSSRERVWHGEGKGES